MGGQTPQQSGRTCRLAVVMVSPLALIKQSAWASCWLPGVANLHPSLLMFNMRQASGCARLKSSLGSGPTAQHRDTVILMLALCNRKDAHFITVFFIHLRSKMA